MTNTERREYNIQRTIDVALQCFQEIGIEATTQIVLAKKVGLTTKTIQRYFKSKDEIVLLSMKKLNDHYYELIKQQLEKHDVSSMTGMDELIAFFEAHEVFFHQKNRILLLMSEMHLYLIRHNIQEKVILMQINAAPPEQQYVLLGLEKGIRDGSVRRDIDIRLIYAFITTTFSGMIQRIMLLPDTYDGLRKGVDKKEILSYYIQKVKADLQPL